MNRKKLMMILATATIMVTLLVPMMTSQLAIAATYDADNMVVNGVLETDTYVLYPYEDDESFVIGFSKYGELINGEAKQGLEYDGLDVFANPNVLEKDWSQGWLIDIHYADLANTYKRAWAYALYTDLSGISGIGGDWQEGVTNGPLGTPYGGRKTNVWATTDDIKVLYDGPRRFVALTNTTIYDSEDKTTDDALVSVAITIVFNKVKKHVTLYKDIKRLDRGKFGRTFQVEFSNRGEWDIGTSSAPPAYAHFYDNLTTEYDGEYHEFYNTTDPLGFDVAQMIDEGGSYVGFAAFWPPLYGKLVDGTTHITRSTILTSLCTKEKTDTWNHVDSGTEGIMKTFATLGYPTSTPYPVGLGVVSDKPMVFINNILQTGGGVDYTWDGTNDQITFMVEPQSSDVITVVYKHETNPGDDDLISHAGIEPDTPYVIGEWCFDLENADHKRMFRAVTLYGLMDRHNGDDNDAASELWSYGANTIDKEVSYYLNECFNPYDLNQAVHKETRRWVYKTTLVVPTTSIALAQKPVIKPTWDAYCTFAERVLVNGVLKKPYRADPIFYGYTLSVNSATGVGTITFKTTLAAGTHVKILYSTLPEWSDSDTVTWSAITNTTNATQGDTSQFVSYNFWTTSTVQNPLGMVHNFGLQGAQLNVTLDDATENFTESIFIDLDLGADEFKVPYDPNVPYVTNVSAGLDEEIIETGTNISAVLDTSGVDWWATLRAMSEATMVDTFDVDYTLNITAVYNTSAPYTYNFNVSMILSVDYSYTEHQMGDYEWMVVGTDAATIDSAGAAYMTQAFDSKKQIHVRMTGLDIRDTAYAPNAPYVMAGATTNDRDDYYYDYPTDMRQGLHDDWCTTTPVASSNMLFSGGPRANLGTEYFNEFTMAFYAAGENVVSDIGHKDKILALSCWDKKYYGSGYAAISVYKDINGTVGFLIWGMDGQDTYYAAKWFWDSGIYYLQQENCGITDIILKITYPVYDPIHPSFSVVERLGTISEKPQHDCPVEEIPV